MDLIGLASLSVLYDLQAVCDLLPVLLAGFMLCYAIIYAMLCYAIIYVMCYAIARPSYARPAMLF